MFRDLRVGVYGLALGYTLSWMGFSDYDEIVAMLSLENPRLWLSFALAVLVAGIVFRYDHRAAPRRHLHPGVIPGSIVFGIGWAIIGVCPGSGLTQLGEGQAPALLSMSGIVFGTWFYGALHKRFFRWDTGSCGL
jgi:uncharacterized protein